MARARGFVEILHQVHLEVGRHLKTVGNLRMLRILCANETLGEALGLSEAMD